MKKSLSIFLLVLNIFAFSQSHIKVLTSDTQKPIAEASIFCEDQYLGSTDVGGNLSFSTKCKKVKIMAAGYYTDVAVVDKVLEVALTKVEAKLQSIETVVLQDKSDPLALGILQKVNDHYKNNSPLSLDSYSFKSYEKLSMDFDEDSIAQYQDFIRQRMEILENLPENTSNKQQKDSIETLKSMKVLTQSKMFLWERAQEFLYSKKSGEKINILDNRMSGFQQPMYEMMTLRSNRMQVPREIRPENRKLYRYFLTDTIEIDGRKNFVIRFREVNFKTPQDRSKYSGYLYIDTETYGLKKLESNSRVKNEGSITSIWTYEKGKWFLQHENYKVKIGNISLDNISADNKNAKINTTTKQKFKTYGYLISDYFDYKSPIDKKNQDFSGYTFSIKNSDGKLLDKYRTDSLSLREYNTYTTIDSLGQQYNADNRINMLLGLLRGKIRWNMVDFDLGKIIDFNLQEGWRLGLGTKLNEKFNKFISPDAYFAYGFKDHRWKYGIGTDVKTSLEKNSFFRAEYYDEVNPAGQFNRNLWNFRMNVLNMGSNMNNDHYYTVKGFKIAYENDLTNSLTLNFSLKRDKEKPLFDYAFFGGYNFTNISSLLTLKYSPFSKNIMTPSGKFVVEQGVPEIFFNYEQSLKSFGSDYDFGKFDVLVTHILNSKLGVFGIRVYGGFITGKAPIWHHFLMSGMASSKFDINFNINTYLGFATMQGGKYYNDQFFGHYLTYGLPWYFKSFGKNVSNFDVVYKGIIGDMKHPEYHQFEFDKLNHMYQEVGVEWNNFLSSYFNLGLFYRVGYYHSPNFLDNFAVQFKLKILRF